MNRILILIILVTLLILLVFAYLSWKGYQISKETLSVNTYQKEYQIKENPRIKIDNNLTQTVCFSSCYPYYLERNNESLKSYTYPSCPYADVAETCIKPRETKDFEILLDKVRIEKGVHRIAIPVCIGCSLKENFRQDQFFYSNKFLIK